MSDIKIYGEHEPNGSPLQGLRVAFAPSGIALVAQRIRAAVF